MGGFSPPVATPATTDQGIRLQSLLETATSLVRDVDSDVVFENPNDSILTVLTEKIRKTDSCDQYKAEWPFIPSYPLDFTVGAAVTAVATQVTFTGTEYLRLRRGHQCMNVRTGEIFSIGGAAEPAAAAVDVVGRVNPQDMVVGDPIRLIGIAMEENSEAPAIRTQREQFDYNYVQIFYEKWGVSLLDKNANSYLGNDLALERRKAMTRYNMAREQVAIFGRRYHSATAGAINGSMLNYAGGAYEFIKSNRWNLLNTRPTQDQFNTFLGELFAHGDSGFTSQAGTARKLGLLSPDWFRLIEGWVGGKIVYDNITDEKRRVGVKVGFLQTSVGEVMLALHPMLQAPAFKDKSLWLDIPQIKMTTHKGFSTTVLENIQTPGSLRTEHGVVSAITWKWMGDERAHGIVEGLGLGI